MPPVPTAQTSTSSAVRDGARFVATNDDPSFPTPTGFTPGAGSIVASVATAAGRAPTIAGKPHAPIYQLAFAAIDKARGEATKASRILAVGDGLNTDILGANRVGVDALLVTGAGGIHNEKSKAPGLKTVAITEGLTW